jgi:hypothetical protein
MGQFETMPRLRGLLAPSGQKNRLIERERELSFELDGTANLH